MCGLYALSAEESRHTVHCSRRIHIFLTEVVEDLNVQRAVMPLVRFVQIDCDLHSHCIRHFTRVPAIPVARCRTTRSRRTAPTSGCARAGSLRAACQSSSEFVQMQDCA